MKAAIISLGSVSSKMTAKAMKKYFDSVDDIDIKDIEINLGQKKPEVLYKGKPFENGYDCIYAKGSFRYSSLLQAITLALGKSAYMPIKPDAFTIGHNKLLTHLKLQEFSIPMPKTYLAPSSDSAKDVLRKIHYPIVMKFPEGTQGKGVMVSESFASASSVLDAMTALKQPLIIQEYIDTGETDIRVIIVGEKVAACMTRKAVRGEMRANIHAGGEGEVCTLDAHTKKIAIETAKAVGAEICAVDILQSIKGPMVIEINLSPGLQGITNVTNIDVADKIAKFLYEQTLANKENCPIKDSREILEDLGIEAQGKIKEIMTNLDFRGERILLPKIITNLSSLKEEDEVTIKAEKGEIIIRKSC